MLQHDREVPTRHFAAGSARTGSDCVVVTGASSGIGAETAVALAGRGIAVAIAARRGARLAETVQRCEAAGGQAHPVVADVTRRGDVEALRDRALERFGGVFAWVNNAGRGNSRPVEAMTEEELDAMLALNLKGALFGMQAILPHFRQHDEGVIVNVASILGRVPLALRGGYAAAKHALLGLSGCLRQELAAEGSRITVCSVLPGPVSTEFSTAAEGEPGNAQRMGRVRDRFLERPEYRGWLLPQTAAEVGEIVAEAVFHPKPEIYTSAGLKAHALAYAEDPEARDALMRPVAETILGR